MPTTVRPARWASLSFRTNVEALARNRPQKDYVRSAEDDDSSSALLFGWFCTPTNPPYRLDNSGKTITFACTKSFWLMKRPVTPVPLLLLLLLLAILSSCRRDAAFHDALVRAEALMETDPQEARALLAEIEDSILKIEDYPAEEAGQKTRKNFQSSIFNFQSKSEAALYALLRTQADYKCDVPLTSDSLILLATDYYGTKRKTQRAALAQHYLGCTYIEMHRDLDAIEAQLRATTLFPDTTNKYFANSLFELGILYFKHYMVDSAWVAFGRYRRTESCNSDSANISYADYHMGATAFFYDNDELTDSLFQCVLNNTKTTNDNRFTTYFQLAKLRFYHQHDIEGALAYLKKNR